jgi:hypothetical protein
MIAPRRRRLAVSAGTVVSAATVVVLVSLAAAGSQARRSLSYRPASSAGTVVDALRQATMPLASLAAAAAIAVLVSMTIRRRRSTPGRAARRRMTRRERALTAIAALLALAAVMTARVVAADRRGRPAARPSHSATSAGSGSQSQWHLSPGAGAVLAVVAVLVMFVAALVVRSHRRRPAALADPTAGLLAQAAAGGRRALLAATDPRDAIVAAYLAMEDHLSENGFELTRSRTAGEVLTDAAGGGYVNREAGTVLVRLFERARFSAAPLTVGDRDHALAALDVLAARVLR